MFGVLNNKFSSWNTENILSVIMAQNCVTYDIKDTHLITAADMHTGTLK